MKSLLTVLIVLLAVSSTQARVIPMDSIISYINESMEMSQELRQQLEPANPEDTRIAVSIFPTFQETSSDIVHAKYYYQQLDQCGASESICHGLGQVCSDLSRKIRTIKAYLPDIIDPAFRSQVNDVIRYLEQFIEDIIGSNPSKECRKYIRDGQWVTD